MMTENTRDTERRSEQRVAAILESNRSWKTKYKSLLNMLEHSDQRVKARAKATLQIMENQAVFMDAVRRDPRLESTFSNALGQLVPKVVDLVRIFYPNLIAHELVDIQPIDRQNGEIFVVRPVYTNSAAGVTAGQQVFQHVTDGTYASENTTVVIGTGNGTLTTFTATAAPVPMRPGTLLVSSSDGTISGQDNGSGEITGTGIASGSTVNYTTGAITVNTSAAVANSVSVTGSFRYDSEQNTSQMRSLDIQLSLIPVTAQPHPLRVQWSTQAQLAAASHLDLDIPDTLANLVSSFIKQERDMDLINKIVAAATSDTNLNFDATPPSNYSKLARYAEIELKLNYAESKIQLTMGRGGVSWILCGNYAADLFRNCAGFEPSDVVAPVGPHKIGTLRDGTVAIIKVPSMSLTTYVVGFKGYVVGDAAAILAEWVPLYASPVFQAPDLSNQQGMMSLYTTIINNAGYYLKGSVSNYVA